MRVAIAEIPEEGLRLTERIDSASLGLETSDLNFEGPVVVSAFFQTHDDDLVVAVEAEGVLAPVCARCLRRFQQPYQGVFQLGIEIHRRKTIDVTDDIRQEIVLSYPMSWLCHQDCRGLCPSCGSNLNEGPCACPQQSSAPGA